jgi:hypothetical protein
MTLGSTARRDVTAGHRELKAGLIPSLNGKSCLEAADEDLFFWARASPNEPAEAVSEVSAVVWASHR